MSDTTADTTAHQAETKAENAKKRQLPPEIFWAPVTGFGFMEFTEKISSGKLSLNQTFILAGEVAVSVGRVYEELLKSADFKLRALPGLAGPALSYGVARTLYPIETATPIGWMSLAQAAISLVSTAVINPHSRRASGMPLGKETNRLFARGLYPQCNLGELLILAPAPLMSCEVTSDHIRDFAAQRPDAAAPPPPG